MFQTLNKLLLKKGLHTVQHVIEEEKTREDNARLLVESICKLLAHKNKKIKVKAILRPFKRKGFECIVDRMNLSKKKEGLEDLDYTLEIAYKRKGFAHIFGFDCIGYLKRQMYE
jgi:hypothetical protein